MTNDHAVLEQELLTALQEEVKLMDEDKWKYAGPRSQIHLISRPSKFLTLFLTTIYLIYFSDIHKRTIQLFIPSSCIENECFNYQKLSVNQECQICKFEMQCGTIEKERCICINIHMHFDS